MAELESVQKQDQKQPLPPNKRGIWVDGCLFDLPCFSLIDTISCLGKSPSEIKPQKT